METTERSLAITQIILLLSAGNDEIFLETKCGAPLWPADGNHKEKKPLRPSFQVPKDSGEQYIRDNFGCQPDRIVDVRFLPDC